MEKVNYTKAALSGLLFFALMTLAGVYGPLSTHDSLLESAVGAAITAVIFTVLMSWMGQYDTDRHRPVLLLDDGAASEVDALMAQGKKVAAVKAVRDATGADLKTALNTVEARAGRESQLS